MPVHLLDDLVERAAVELDTSMPPGSQPLRIDRCDVETPRLRLELQTLPRCKRDLHRRPLGGRMPRSVRHDFDVALAHDDFENSAILTHVELSSDHADLASARRDDEGARGILGDDEERLARG